MITFYIPGTPKSTQPGHSVRLANGRSYQPKTHPEWIAWCRLIATHHAPRDPLDGPLMVSVTYALARPKSAPKSQRFPWRRPDVENYGKGLFDAFNGLLWHDDAQIVWLVLSKRYCEDGEAPGVWVQAQRMEAHREAGPGKEGPDAPKGELGVSGSV